MSITQLNGACPAILVGINEILGDASPVNTVTPLAIQALLDPENLRGTNITQLQGNENGHIKSVRVMRHQRALPTDIRDGKSCDPGTERPYLEDVYSVNITKEHVIKVKESTVRRLCDAYSQYISIPLASRSTDGVARSAAGVMREIVEVLMLDLDVMRQAINAEFISFLGLHIGTWSDQDDNKDFNIFDTNGNFDRRGMGSLKQELKKTGIKGRPILIGGGNIDKYFEDVQYGCCNAGGYDFGMANASAPYKLYADYDLGTELGNENAFVAFLPKTLQLLTFNDYVGEFAREHDSVQRGTFPDPELPGVRYDMRIVPNRCDEDYDIFLNLNFDFYAAPSDLYAAGDRIEEVNGIFQGVATNA